jgi:hypothetical protein
MKQKEKKINPQIGSFEKAYKEGKLSSLIKSKKN